MDPSSAAGVAKWDSVAHKECQRILKELLKDPDAATYFYAPVSLIACPDYKDHVSHPMCLSLIEVKTSFWCFCARQCRCCRNLKD